MALEDILKKIEADAEEACRGIIAEARREAEAALEAARRKAAAEAERIRARATQRADEERNRILTLARLAARRELLSEKRALIDRVFEETRESIMTMPADEYGHFIRALLRQAVEAGDEEVIVGEGERRIDQRLLDGFSQERGTPGGLRLSTERRPIDGGFVLRRGKTETNCSLETVLRGARERLETEVAGILFAEDATR